LYRFCDHGSQGVPPVPVRFRRILLLLVVLFAAGGTTGCATAFLYERADRLANRWVGDYVELTEERQAALDAGLADLHAWHRSEQLPAYADWLRTAGARLEDPAQFSAAELQERGAELGRFWHAIGNAALPLALDLGASLEDAEVAGFIRTLRERNDKEYAAAERRPEEWHEQRRARSMERALRRWTGRLTEEQRARIGAWAAELEPSRSASFENRRGWVDELQVALDHRHERARLAEAAGILLITPSARWSPEYRALIERNSLRTAGFLADFLNNLEERQRVAAVERFRRLAMEFDELSRSAG
jgi:hypothetical protein